MSATLPDPFDGFLGAGTLLFPTLSAATSNDDGRDTWTPMYNIKDLSHILQDSIHPMLTTLELLMKYLFIAVSRRQVDTTLILRIYIIPNDSALRKGMKLNEKRILNPARQGLRKLLSLISYSTSLWHGDLTGRGEQVGLPDIRKPVGQLSFPGTHLLKYSREYRIR